MTRLQRSASRSYEGIASNTAVPARAPTRVDRAQVVAFHSWSSQGPVMVRELPRMGPR